MGFFSNLRAARDTGFAVEFVKKQLDLEASLSAFHGNTKELAHSLVIDLWSKTPELAQQKASPKSVLLAAAALAHGVKLLDGAGKKDVADFLFRCLRASLSMDVIKLVDSTNLSPIDAKLWNIATSVFE
ncbi:hypothetical protein INR38_18885 [Delftia sp. SD018]|uniref:hypothetical protein n=1 Tax=unclassified Delftia TaxID=2613839 RepID=UPI001A973A85|nr:MULTISPECIES: hypothetical protein [unclassified Delftia]MBO0987565.1 hypothetical protein [Delftia sp. SD083]MBO1036144.1 hypothetical protein [Delftia sp. SD018]